MRKKDRDRERVTERFIIMNWLCELSMEAEKSYNLLSTSWKPRRASGAAQTGSESMRKRRTYSEVVPVQTQEKTNAPP